MPALRPIADMDHQGGDVRFVPKADIPLRSIFLLFDHFIGAALAVMLDGETGFEGLATHFPRPLDDSTTIGRAILLKQVVQFAPIPASLAH